MKTPVVRFTGSPDSNPAQWLRINELTTQPGPGSAYKVTIEEMPKIDGPPVFLIGSLRERWVAGALKYEYDLEAISDTLLRFQNGTAAIGSTREEALANLAKAKARGPL